MTRRHEDSNEGREAQRLFGGLWNRGVHVPSSDNERGANEGLSRREIRALAEENGPPMFGESSRADRAEAAVRWRAHVGGHDVPEHRGTPRRESSR